MNPMPFPTVGQPPISNSVVASPPIPEPPQINTTDVPPSPPPPPQNQPSSAAKTLMLAVPFFTALTTFAFCLAIINTSRQKYNPQSKASGGTLEIQPTKIMPSKETVAKKVVTWLDGQKNQDGIYYLAETIPFDLTKVEPITDNRVGTYVIWAKYRAWKKTADPQTLASLKTDLDVHNDPQKVRLYQPDFWSCKLLLQLKEDKNLPPEIQASANNLCLRRQTILPDLSTQEENLQEIFTAPASDTPKDVNAQNRFTQYGAFVSDFATLYLSDKKPETLNTAEKLFNAVISQYKNLRSTKFEPGACVLGIAAADLYRASGQQKYLDFARDLFVKRPVGQTTNLLDKATCVIFSQELNGIKSETSYVEFKQQAINNLIYTNYDDNFGVFSNMMGENIVRPIKENSLIAGVLFE